MGFNTLFTKKSITIEASTQYVVGRFTTDTLLLILRAENREKRNVCFISIPKEVSTVFVGFSYLLPKYYVKTPRDKIWLISLYFTFCKRRTFYKSMEIGIIEGVVASTFKSGRSE